MKMKIVGLANNTAELNKLAKQMDESTIPAVKAIYGDACIIMHKYASGLISAALYEVISEEGQVHYSFGYLDHDGVTHIVDSGIGGSTKPSISMPLDAFNSLYEKDRRYDQIITASGRHIQSMSIQSIPGSLDTVDELHQYLDQLQVPRTQRS